MIIYLTISKGIGHTAYRRLLGLAQAGIIFSFHQVSIKHLHRYLSEFQFRWNNREAQDIFLLVIAALVIGSSLPYAKLIEPLEGERGTGPEGTLDEEPF